MRVSALGVVFLGSEVKNKGWFKGGKSVKMPDIVDNSHLFGCATIPDLALYPICGFLS